MQTPYRLVVVTVCEGVDVVALCGPEPSLSDVLEQVIVPCWQPAMEYISTTLTVKPHTRNVSMIY